MQTTGACWSDCRAAQERAPSKRKLICRTVLASAPYLSDFYNFTHTLLSPVGTRVQWSSLSTPSIPRHYGSAQPEVLTALTCTPSLLSSRSQLNVRLSPAKRASSVLKVSVHVAQRKRPSRRRARLPAALAPRAIRRAHSPTYVNASTASWATSTLSQTRRVRTRAFRARRALGPRLTDPRALGAALGPTRRVVAARQQQCVRARASAASGRLTKCAKACQALLSCPNSSTSSRFRARYQVLARHVQSRRSIVK